ncbi:MAG: NADH:ubiquinone oxidoreductase [Comamonadaceae bacterium]|nr:MAG: NADH:ubiquinone oxidoreductase [Comamonadaceae bacterium]
MASTEKTAAVLLARSSVTGAASREMEELAASLQATGEVGHVTHAFSEQGTPSLREVLTALAGEGFEEVRILPCLLPMEPGFRVWIDRSINRWRAEEPLQHGPSVRVAQPPGSLGAMQALLRDMLASEPCEPAPTPASALPSAGSLIPSQKRRVLVCQGGPCNNAGAAVIWGHLRNEQKRLNLRTTGDGVMTAKSTCLGPCNLAPVLQVFPEGTYYGGVDEAGIDRIIEEHLLGGRVLRELAYDPLPVKQALR